MVTSHHNIEINFVIFEGVLIIVPATCELCFGESLATFLLFAKLAELFCCEISTFLKREKIFLSLFPILRNQKVMVKIEKMYPQN